jgi:hypothetical protein
MEVTSSLGLRMYVRTLTSPCIRSSIWLTGLGSQFGSTWYEIFRENLFMRPEIFQLWSFLSGQATCKMICRSDCSDAHFRLAMEKGAELRLLECCLHISLVPLLPPDLC